MSDAPPLTLSVLPNGHLKPLNRFDQERIMTRYPVGARVRARVTMPRSKLRHRLYWSVLAEIVAATGERWCDTEDLHESVKIALRMMRGVSLLGGGVRYVTRSTEWEKMGEDEFKIFFDKAMIIIQEDTGIDTQAVIDELTRKDKPSEAVA